MSKAKQATWRTVAPAPVVLVFGPEDFLSANAVRNVRNQLRKADPELEIHEVMASEYGSGQLYSMASPSLFSQPRLIIVEAMERCSDSFIDDGKAYLANPDPDTTVVIKHNGSSVRGKALLDALRASELVVEVSCAKITKDEERAAFVRAEFAAENRKISDGGVRALTNAFSEDLSELGAACDQLMADSAEQVDEAIVDKYFGGRIETAPYKIVDLAIDGAAGEALLLLRHGLATNTDVIPVIASFASKIRQLARVHSDRGIQPAVLGVSPWVLNKIRAQAAAWSDEGLSRALNLVAEADVAAKGGGDRQPEYLVENLVLLVAARGEVR